MGRNGHGPTWLWAEMTWNRPGHLGTHSLSYYKQTPLGGLICLFRVPLLVSQTTEFVICLLIIKSATLQQHIISVTARRHTVIQ